MQEQQNNFPEESRDTVGEQRQAREIISFHEVVNPLPPEMDHTFQYFIGLAIGCIPLVLFFLPNDHLLDGNTSSSTQEVITVCSYLALWFGSLVCLCISRVRFIGYGLFTMAIILLASWIIGYIVTISQYCGRCR